MLPVSHAPRYRRSSLVHRRGGLEKRSTQQHTAKVAFLEEAQEGRAGRPEEADPTAIRGRGLDFMRARKSPVFLK